MSNHIYKKQTHHITPKCLLKHKDKSFIDHPSNLVELEYRYHVAVHKWLFMLTGNKGCEYAYNAMKTGKFYYDSTNNKYWLGRHHKEKSKQKISKKLKEYYKTHKHPCDGKKLSYNTKQKISKSTKGKKLSEIQVKNMTGHRSICSKTYKITFPDGKIEIVTGIRQFCRKYNLTATTMCKVAKNKQNHHKGYKCKLL